MFDKQDVMPVAYCVVCGEEIYPGERVLEVDEGLIHNELSCIRWYIDEHYLNSDDTAEDLMRLLRIPTRAAS